MEVRVKERLVGAIALVAIVVIVVPELLTGERSAPPKAAVAGPVPVRTVTIDLASSERGAIARAADPPAAAPSSPPAAAAAPAAPVEAPPDPRPAPAAASVPAPTTAAAAAPGASRTPTPAVAVAHPGEAWIVQLGSFASRENAEHLAAALRAKSYSAFVAEFRGSGRVLYRVRVGPEQDRARADAIAARLAREGHKGSVAPEP